MKAHDEKPLVSVIMGVRYRRDSLFLLERSITSILNQTYQNLELLICEAESTNEARKWLTYFVEKDPRVKLINGVGSANLSKQLNQCLKAAKGKWIARMDDDDSSDPSRLSVQMNYLQTHPQTAFVGCIARLEREGKPAGFRRLPENPTIRDFFLVQPFLHPTLLFRREVLEKVGGYSEEPRCLGCEDYDLLLQLYEMGLTGANVQEPLFIYTLPPLGNPNRNMVLRWNEVKTRYVRFRALGLLPKTLPYVVKPLAVGLMPNRLLERIKDRRRKRVGH